MTYDGVNENRNYVARPAKAENKVVFRLETVGEQSLF